GWSAIRLPGHLDADATRAGLRRVRPARRLPPAQEPPEPLSARQALQRRRQPPGAGGIAAPPSRQEGRLRTVPHDREGPMTFTELPFWELTAVVFCLWLAVRHNYRATVGVLLAGSVVFYGYHRWQLLFLIFAYCVVDWATALWLERSSRPRLVLGMGVSFNLLVLAYWKYTPLLVRTFALSEAPGNWIIPFGISFYSFTGIAYFVDVYRRVTPAEHSLLRYTLSAMFFPHLVAGPILRPDEFLTKLRPEVMPARTEAPLEAVFLLARGFFKKVVLADRLALGADPFFLHVGDVSTAGVWALPYVYFYALQIYFDFSGYTYI